MSITFQKRQKELKRQEKQRLKAEKRELRKAAKHAAKDPQVAPPILPAVADTSSEDHDILLDTKVVSEDAAAE